MKIVDQLIVYLDGMGLLSDTEKLQLWQRGYLPEVNWSEQEAATGHEPDSRHDENDWIDGYALWQRQQIVHELRIARRHRGRARRDKR